MVLEKVIVILFVTMHQYACLKFFKLVYAIYHIH